MKLFLILILIVSTLTSTTTAITIEEYIALPEDEKIKVLRKPPVDMVADLSKLVQLHTISLRDESLKVQKIAAWSSFGLVHWLQTTDEEDRVDRLSEISNEDSAAFQEALVAVLGHDDPEARGAATRVLTMSAPPHPQIEAMLLERIRIETKRLEAEGTEDIRGDIIEGLAQVGYRSEHFVALTMELMHSEDIYYNAAEVLTLLTPEDALDTLIELAESKEAPARWRAVKVLAAYGGKAIRAKPMLERLIEDQTIRSEIRDNIHQLAARTLEAIILDKPEPSNLRVVKLVPLWPLALPEDETAEAHELNVSSTELDESNKPPSQIASKQERSIEEPSVDDSSDSPEELREHTWIWLGVLLVLIITGWIVLKRFR